MSDTPPPPPGGGPHWGALPPDDMPPPGYGYVPPVRKRRVWPGVMLVLLLVLTGGCVGALALIGKSMDDESDRSVKVRYAVTGDARSVSITYSIWKNGSLSSNGMSGVRLPWRKEAETSGFVRGGSLTVTVGADGGSATCTVAVDGQKPQTATATGRSAVATCDGR